MKRIVHYLNQFYGQIGGEEFADQEPILREGIVGTWHRSAGCSGGKG